MSKSARLRAQDWRALLRVVGECRELGDDSNLWRAHLLATVCGLVDADLGLCPEMGGFARHKPADLGVVLWGAPPGYSPAVRDEVHARISGNPAQYEAVFAYFERLAASDGVCHSRQTLMADRDWYRSTSYEAVHRLLGVDHALWCFRSLPGYRGDQFGGLLLKRAIGRRDFTARDRAIVYELQAAVTAQIGGPLARFAEPSPRELAPRVRQVLACLLEGDGDKQVAVRLYLSQSTVNQYTKIIFRHFHVSSRAELLARWVRRGYPAPFSWTQ
jgi:DNA-binding CsgD family transcriptional regulator